jgi:hypothetical protein
MLESGIYNKPPAQIVPSPPSTGSPRKLRTQQGNAQPLSQNGRGEPELALLPVGEKGKAFVLPFSSHDIGGSLPNVGCMICHPL